MANPSKIDGFKCKGTTMSGNLQTIKQQHKNDNKSDIK